VLIKRFKEQYLLVLFGTGMSRTQVISLNLNDNTRYAAERDDE